jgi:hypothetical protein
VIANIGICFFMTTSVLVTALDESFLRCSGRASERSHPEGLADPTGIVSKLTIDL